MKENKKERVEMEGTRKKKEEETKGVRGVREGAGNLNLKTKQHIPSLLLHTNTHETHTVTLKVILIPVK